MKKLLVLSLALVFGAQVGAQIETPAPSPFAKLEQVVGLTDVTIEYSRPSMRGRVIFGDLVPFGKTWRTGANMNTKITFSNPITVDGQTLAAGTYAIYTVPNAENWEVMFYTDSNNGGLPREWDDSKVAAKTTVPVYTLPFDVQTFTIDINNLTNSSATIDMIWEKTYIGVPFSVPTDDAVMAAIERTMSGPGFGDYYAAATYYLSEGKDMMKAKKWIDKAMSMTDTPRFWQLRQQSLIYAAAGDKKGAIELAKKSLAGAEAAGNADYVKMNKESIAEWMQ